MKEKKRKIKIRILNNKCKTWLQVKQQVSKLKINKVEKQ